jgi:hypothetical protein
MTDPTIQFYNSIKPHFDNQLNGSTDYEKRIKRSIQDQSPERLVEIIINVDEFIKQHPGIREYKDNMWKHVLSKSTKKTKDGEFVHEISPGHQLKFKTWEEFLKHLNKEIVPIVMGYLDQAYARILVEYYVRTIIDGLKIKDRTVQIEFLKKSLTLIFEKEELSKYLKGKISEHLNYYKKILEIHRSDFDNVLFINITEGDGIAKLKQALADERFADFVEILRPIFASIPHQIIVNNEKYYHSIFFVILTLLGFDILAEVSTNLGRIDAVIELDKIVYILEFKMNEADTAIQQIKEKKYYEKYEGKSKKIVLVGVAFDRNHRNIGGFKLENYKRI